MKLVRFQDGSRESYGVMTDAGIADVGELLQSHCPTLESALSLPGRVETAIKDAVVVDPESVVLLSPVTNPGKIVCVGLNYKSHIAETGRDTPDYPILFTRYPDSLVGSGAPLVRPKVSTNFDFEGELAFVIGKAGRHIGRAQALEHVAGYACFNDGSIRDYQRHTSQFLPGKSFYRSGSFGPYLVTADEAGPVEDMHLQTRLNGAVMQDTSVSDLLFGVEDLIVYLSKIWPLQTGDVIATGTTGGVGAFREPKLWMQPGDTIEVEISGLGVLSNTIIDE